METNRLVKGCQDIDDALHARRLPNGNIEAGVREFDASLGSNALYEVPLQTSQTFLILFFRKTRWMQKLLHVGRQYISLTNA